MTSIAITGATGQVGRELALFLQRMNIPNRLLIRDVNKASFLQHQSSTILPFDFMKKETFEKSLHGADRLFLACDASIDDRQIAFFLAAVKEFGIQQIVFMSGMGADKDKTDFLSRLEHLVSYSGISHIALRANWFFQNFGSYFKSMIKEKHELCFPDGGASISFVDARDIAEIALHFLTQAITEDGLAFPITGPESLSHVDVAKLFSKHLPYEVKYRQLTEMQAREELGWTEDWIHLFRDIQKGITAPVSDSVKKILGKSPSKLEDYIIENKSLWIA